MALEVRVDNSAADPTAAANPTGNGAPAEKPITHAPEAVGPDGVPKGFKDRFNEVNQANQEMRPIYDLVMEASRNPEALERLVGALGGPEAAEVLAEYRKIQAGGQPVGDGNAPTGAAPAPNDAVAAALNERLQRIENDLGWERWRREGPRIAGRFENIDWSKDEAALAKICQDNRCSLEMAAKSLAMDRLSEARQTANDTRHKTGPTGYVERGGVATPPVGHRRLEELRDLAFPPNGGSRDPALVAQYFLARGVRGSRRPE
jgi:hypothetical protein